MKHLMQFTWLIIVTMLLTVGMLGCEPGEASSGGWRGVVDPTVLPRMRHAEGPPAAIEAIRAVGTAQER